MENSEITDADTSKPAETELVSTPKSSNKWLKIVLLGVFGVVFAGGLVYVGYWYGKESAKLKPPKSEIPTPAVTQLPTPTSTPPTEGKTADWKTYTNKEIIENSGLYLKIPSGWIIKYRKTDKLSQDYNANFRIEFDFSPPGWKVPSQSIDWMGWRIMDIDVYGTKTDINQWITDYLPKYKNGLTVSETKTIGNKTAYLISASPNSEFFDGWTPRFVVLGKDYSYELGFNNNGELNSDKIIEKDIYPGIYFN